MAKFFSKVAPRNKHWVQGTAYMRRGWLVVSPGHWAKNPKKGPSPEAVATTTLGYKGTFGSAYRPLTQPRTGRRLDRRGRK
jgi:hypothetical protein